MAAHPSSLAERDRLDDIVDLTRYPIVDLHAPAGRALVEDCRARFEDGVSCELKGFLHPAAVAAVVAAVEAREANAFLSARHRGAYGFYGARHGEVPEGLREGDPHAEPQWRQVGYLGYDEFAPDSILHRLYESSALAAFARAVLDVPEFFPVEDPLMAAPISLHRGGCTLGWHCDTQEFTVTAMFRRSESGGVFQYLPLAGPGDANFHRVPEVFAGNLDGVREVDIEPGSIMLFRGANTLHRVSPTGGERPRILSVFHFERTPGRVFPDEWKMELFGRSAPRAS